MLLAALLLAGPVAQAAPGADARREIAQLISSLDGSSAGSSAMAAGTTAAMRAHTCSASTTTC